MNSTVVKIKGGELLFVDGSEENLKGDPKFLNSLNGYQELSESYPEDEITATFENSHSWVMITTSAEGIDRPDWLKK